VPLRAPPARIRIARRTLAQCGLTAMTSISTGTPGAARRYFMAFISYPFWLLELWKLELWSLNPVQDLRR
jgi:hypothetical protein